MIRVGSARVLATMVLVVLTACSSRGTASHSPSPRITPPPSASLSAAPSPSPTPTPTPTPTPSPVTTPVPTYAAASVSCSGSISSAGSLAILRLGTSTTDVIADVTNPASPVTLCTLSGGNGSWQFIDRGHLSYLAYAGSDFGAATGIFELTIATNTTSAIEQQASAGFASGTHRWSSDGNNLTYILSDSSGVQWHLLNSSGDRLLASFGPIPGRGGSFDDDIYVGFSQDGTMVGLASTFFGETTSKFASTVQVRRLDGTLVYSTTPGTMGTWQAASFYFRQDDGVHVVNGGSVSLAISAVKWLRPSTSPNGEDVAFTTFDSAGLPHASTYGHSGRSGGEIPGIRAWATWINATTLWYEEERACTPSDNCTFTSFLTTGNHFLKNNGTVGETSTAISLVESILPWSPR